MKFLQKLKVRQDLCNYAANFVWKIFVFMQN